MVSLLVGRLLRLDEFFGVFHSVLVVESLVAGTRRPLGVVGRSTTWSALNLLLALVAIVLIACSWLRVRWRYGSMSWHLDGPIPEAGQDLLTRLRSSFALEIAKRITISYHHTMVVRKNVSWGNAPTGSEHLVSSLN